MTIKKYIGYKVRLYPTKEQEELFIKHIGHCRYIWNYMLDLQKETYANGGKYLSAFSMIKLITPLKRDGDHDWLYEVSNTSLQHMCQDLDNAYRRFFGKKSGFPKHKRKKSAKQAYPICSELMYFCDTTKVQIQKVGKVKFKSDYDFPIGKGHKFCNGRVSYVDKKWFLSFSMECDVQTPVLTDKLMGIDLGIKELAVVAVDGEQLVFHNINKSKRVRELERRKKHIQRSISRKYEANKKGNVYVKTKNIEREEEKLRKIYRKLSNIRNNYIHQVTHKLVSMLPRRIVMEDLNVSSMMKNKHLAKSIQDQCWAEFIRQMKYKCEWNGIEFVQVDKFYPSSKTCSCCGSIKKDLKLKDRTYVCSNCGAVIDRDFNAALNLSRYGIANERFRP